MLLQFQGKKPQTGAAAFIAPNATLIGDVRLEEGVSVWFGAVIRADHAFIAIGGNSNIQDNAVLHIDPGLPLNIGKQVTVGHGAVLHGCTIGDNCLIGMGAVILNRAVIGENCIVGAGALVSENAHFPPGSLIVGNPAEVKKELKTAHIELIKAAAARYLEYSRQMAEAVNVQA